MTQQVITEGFRLSPQQERLWILQQDGNLPYRVQCTVLIEGDFDIARFQSALQTVIDGHEILRTSFRFIPGMVTPLQVIADSNIVPNLQQHDLSNIAIWDQKSSVERLFRDELVRPFDLDQGSPLHLSLIKLSPGRSVLLVGSPALYADATGLKNLVSKVLQAYEWALQGEELSAEPMQYADISEWQNQLLESEEWEAGREYWRTQEIGDLLNLRLPLEKHLDNHHEEFSPRILDAPISAGLVVKIKALAQAHETEAADVMLGCWVTLLHKLTGSREVMVSVAGNGRGIGELAGALGLLARSLPVRAKFESGAKFLGVMGEVRLLREEAERWQDYFSYQQLRERRQRPGTELLYPFGFEWQEQAEGVSGGGLSWRITEQWECLEPQKVKLVCVEERSGAWRLQWQYDERVLSAVAMERLAGQYEVVLEQVVRGGAELRVEELEVISERERWEVVEEYNRTAAEYEGGESLAALFEAQVGRTPEAVALVYEAEQVSYRELNQRANQVGHYLQGLGVGAETLVAVMMERSVELVVGLLGVLKAGGAYVPVDPEYPQERVRYMLEDCGARVLLTQAGLVEQSERAAATGCAVVKMDSEWERIAAASEENVPSGVNGANLAYVIYTSGSTGRPKGVMISHQAIRNRLLWMQTVFPLTKSDRILQKTSVSFDASVWELFLPLMAGAQLFLAEPHGHQDPAYLTRVIGEFGITILQLVPSMLDVLLKEPDVEKCQSLRRVFCGGEAFPLKLQGRFFEKFCAELVNLYGPTESSIDATFWRCQREFEPNAEAPHGLVSIGLPLANIQIHILDPQLRPVPHGVSGELHIGGAGLARAYLNQPGLTAEKFIPNPFSKSASARLYKTGDMACVQPGGTIDFLGRTTQQQVKIRGFRIELGEIEAVLGEHPMVQSSLVTADDDQTGGLRLVAYVVPRLKNAGLSDKELYKLPNDVEVYHLNKNETDQIYREIFADQTYLKHGIALSDGDCVFDVGANIGLFTLWVHQQCRNARVYGFEPNPAAFAVMRNNTALYGLDVKLFECGLSDETKASPFTFYPEWSGMSGFYADVKEDEEVVRASMQSQDANFAEYADELLRDRFKSETFTCDLRTISEIIRENNIESIDLLKVDVEKSELDVLNGIDESDWKRIKNIVMEVHDIEGRLSYIATLLSDRGFEHFIEQDDLLKHTNLFNLYAIRPNSTTHLPQKPAEVTAQQPQVLSKQILSRGDLRGYLSERLPTQFIPSAFVLLDRFPLLPNGKIDRQALPEPVEEHLETQKPFKQPVSPVQELIAGIWGDVLGRSQIGIQDNFFDLGGHSLLATQVISRLRRTFSIDLPLRTLFESTTLAALANEVETALRSSHLLETPPIRAIERTGNLPLSFAQQRLWFIDQLEPGSGSYNIGAAVRLTGALDAAALERALGEVVRRHEALRTTFPTINSLPVQLIAAPASLDLAVIDLVSLMSDDSLEDRRKEAQKMADAEVQRPFDLEQGPLLQATLLRVAEEEHVVLVTMHHIVSDGWSTGLLMREVATLYAAYSNGQESPLAELAIQYGDYAAWQREWLQGEVLERELSYWREQLTGAPPVLELPADYARPAVRTFRGARHSFTLEGTLTKAVKQLSRAEGVTLFMTLLAAFKVLLWRYSGQASVVVGTPIAGRTQVEVEELIGFFVNTLVLRTEVSAELSFVELLQRVKEVALGAYAHQEVPFERLVEELEPERSLSHTPLFQVVFVHQNTPRQVVTSSGLRMETLESESRTAHFDLTLTIAEGEDSLYGDIDYRKDLFERATIERLAGHFEQLLQSIVAEPERRVSEFRLLAEGEQQQLLNRWNETQVDVPRELCVHQLFEAQSDRTPDAVALVCEDELLSYAEVNRQANQLAHYLRKKGVGTETLVAVVLERSAKMIVSLLAILKAGGAYVPLDPDNPKEHIAHMLEDVGARVVITGQGTKERLPDQTGGEVVDLDSQREEIAQESDENPEVVTTVANLAYVIYTSGSTGRPKGVELPHAGLVNLVTWHQQAYKLDSTTRATQVARQTFDASVWEIWSCLTSGGSLYLPDEETIRSPPHLWAWIVNRKITHCFLPTPLAEAVLPLVGRAGNEEGSSPPALKYLLTGGDKLHQSAAETLPFVLINHYGPTENTVVSTCEVVGTATDELRVPSIGRPIANSQAYVLEEGGTPAPIGVAGELHVGGKGLARGYLHRAGLTAAKFVPHPYSLDKGARLYRTGDVVRWLVSGELEFVGRMDEQVKLRGYRIELGEIEAMLCSHASVREAAALVAEAEGGQRRLVAYVVTEDGKAGLTVTEMRNFLQEKLPDYMIPAVLVQMDELPMTRNGKLDRKALPKAEQNRGTLGSEYAAPVTPIEEILVNIWSEVLGVVQVGIHDNFFDLGGHSLLATQVISRVRQSFSVDLPLRTLFEATTVALLAPHIETGLRSHRSPAAPPLRALERTENLSLSFAQQRLWFIDQLESGSATYNIAAAARLSGTLDAGALLRALNEVVRRHEALRTSFPTLNGLPVQQIAEAQTLDLPMLDLSELEAPEREREVERLSTLEAQQPFDLGRGPLLRAQLLRMAQDDQVLLFAMHHIVSDGWSMGLLVEELTQLYASYTGAVELSLPELGIQYADYAAWQRDWLQGEVLDQQVGYWREQLAGAPPLLELPTDHPRPSIRSFRGEKLFCELPPKLIQEVTALSRIEGATLFMTLLAAFQTLLHLYSGQNDIVVGTDIANRNQVETEKLIGCFVNNLVMRADMSRNPSFRELLRRVRETAFGAYSHQDVPFDKLLEILRPKRSLSHAPLFQVLFVLQNNPKRTMNLPGLTLTVSPLENGTSKFDLSLFIEDMGQGYVAIWRYNTDVFEAETITRMAKHFETLLRSIVTEPDAPLSKLGMLTEDERREQALKEDQRQVAKRKKLNSTQPRAVVLPSRGLIKTSYLDSASTFPLVAQPGVSDLDPVEWAQNGAEFIETNLIKHGAILFRDFKINSVPEFECCATAMCSQLFTEYGDLPREGNSRKVYHSTPYPAQKAILFHNESSHMHRWPMKQFFYCVQAAQAGGETPIVDCRRVYQNLDPQIVDEFKRRKVMYVRNFTDGLDVSWQEFFKTTDRAAVENYCREACMDFQWQKDGLRIRQVCAAVANHPKTGEPVFFNQLQLHHVSRLEPEVRSSLLSLFGDENLPRNVYYGDGSPIADSVIEEICRVYWNIAVSFPWHSGDILLLDNMLMAHARNPYVGPRKIVVAMGEMFMAKTLET